MAYSILLSSLCATGRDEPMRYYFASEGCKALYCDAMLTAEASAKFILSENPIDEIITLGRKLTFDEGDDGRLIELREGKNFYAADISSLSTYSLFRYRIAQYIDELRIEQQDLTDLLDEKEQEKVVEFLKNFYKNADAQSEYRKFNRFFDELSQDRGMFTKLRKDMFKEIPEAADDPARFMNWTKNYLYSVFKDSGKLEMLRGNEDVKVRFVPTSLSEDGKFPVDNMLQIVHAITDDHPEGVDLYVALHADDQTDSFVLMNVLNIINSMPDSGVAIRNIFTVSDAGDGLSGEIRDDTESYGITDLTAAVRTFLRYGKVDMIIDFWEKSSSHDERLERMIYAMRHIDVGISLCNIREIEGGIERLRQFFEGKPYTGGDDYYGKLFAIMADGIRKDYGVLLEGDDYEFIDLVKWAYRKGFYQQTLTLIESRAPRAFVEHGIFYYCGNEKDTDDIAGKLAAIRADLKPYELYMMDDIDHYFVKYCHRRDITGGNKDSGADNKRIYAHERVRMLDDRDPAMIPAFSLCSDREDLEELYYAYLYVCDLRNRVNHAEEENRNRDGRLIVHEKDLPHRMAELSESIQFFVQCYDKVIAGLGDIKPEVVKIDADEVRKRSKLIITERDAKPHARRKAEPAKPEAAEDKKDAGTKPADEGKNGK